VKRNWRSPACWLLLAALLGTASFSRQANGQRKALADAQAAHDKSEDLDLAMGENRTIPAIDVKNYSEGTPGFIDVKLTTDGTQFVVVGEKPGSTTLLLIHKDGSKTTYNINVFARSPASVEHELSELLDGNVGIHLRRVGARFFLEGGTSSEADLKRIQHIAALYPGQVESLVELGSVAEDRTFNIRIDFYFVQFNKDQGYTVGVTWPSKIGGDNVLTNTVTFDFIARTTTTATATITNQPLPSLDIASRKGWAKVLKQATLITGNGSEAKFSSGGEQNFQIATNFTANIKAITFGVDLTVLPRFDRATREMEVKLEAQNNDLTPPAANTNLPGRNTSMLNTVVHLKLGQSIVLSGISSKSRRHTVNGLPLLSDIPILGVLFGSHNEDASDVEGAVFIIPSVIDSLPRASLDIVNSAMAQYADYEGNIRKVNAYDHVPPAADRPDPPPPIRRDPR
jgi:pilus assembly protein CpaC